MNDEQTLSTNVNVAFVVFVFTVLIFGVFNNYIFVVVVVIVVVVVVVVVVVASLFVVV